MGFKSGEPTVVLHSITTKRAFDLSIAAARSCYANHLVDEDEVAQEPEKRDEIAASTLNAGHLTTRQHAHFTFKLDRVSRHFLWSFLSFFPLSGR